MMVFEKYIVLLMLITAQMFAGAQNYNLYHNNLSQKSNRLQGKLTGEIYYLNARSNNNYFLQPDWVDGTITLKDGDVFTGVRMRYMAYGDELVVYNDNNHSLFIVDKSTVRQFSFPVSNTAELVVRKFINLDSLELLFNKSYFEELYSGNVKLLCFHQIEEKKVTPYTGNDGKLYDFEFWLNNMYYILSDEKGFTRIQLKNHSLLKVYTESKKEIRKEIRKNKINIVNEQSAIQAFRVLDESGFLK